MLPMALEHALLVALCEQPASGLDLTKRFGRSIGFFWSATHQQIYRVLGRMDGDGWVSVEAVAQEGRPDKKVYAVTELGRAALADWLAQPTDTQSLRPTTLLSSGPSLELDQYLVLRGGVLMEQTWITWLTEYLEAHQ